MVNRLPNHSHYKAAILDDDELARQAAQKGMKESHRTMLGFTPEVSAIYDLTSWVKQLLGTTIAVNSDGKYPDLPPTPYPQTAFDRRSKRAFIERHRQRAKLMLSK